MHRLGDLVTIALCAVLCGADDWVAMEVFGHAKATWLRTFLALPNGIPSHDTFGRVFARAGPRPSSSAASWPGCRPCWATRRGRWSPSTARRCAARRIARRAGGVAPGQRLGDRQWAGPGAGGDRREVERDHRHPGLLRRCRWRGVSSRLTRWAARRAIAAQLARTRGGLCARAQGQSAHPARHGADRLCRRGRRSGADAGAGRAGRRRDPGQGHGRLERRRVSALSDPDLLACLDPRGAWPGLRSVVEVQAERRLGARARPSAATICPACRPTRRCSARRSARTGAWRTACIGCSTSSSAKMPVCPGRRRRPESRRAAPPRPQPAPPGSLAPRQPGDQTLPRRPRSHLPAAFSRPRPTGPEPTAPHT